MGSNEWAFAIRFGKMSGRLSTRPDELSTFSSLVEPRESCNGSGMIVTEQRRGVIERYRQHLPVMETTPVVSLGEGSTPLIPCPKLSAIVGRGCEVLLKYEGLNPTGSFKDRGMTVAVSKALERGAQV